MLWHRQTDSPMISIHAPVKGATREAKPRGVKSDISIHAPVKGATTTVTEWAQDNPISIHAPVKGATEWTIKAAGCPAISIHAPVKGATFTLGMVFTMVSDFNPRSREGSDSKDMVYVAIVFISIHAPVKGATTLLKDANNAVEFQSTLP